MIEIAAVVVVSVVDPKAAVHLKPLTAVHHVAKLVGGLLHLRQVVPAQGDQSLDPLIPQIAHILGHIPGGRAMLEQIVDDEQVAVVFPQCVQDAGDAPGYGGVAEHAATQREDAHHRVMYAPQAPGHVVGGIPHLPHGVLHDLPGFGAHRASVDHSGNGAFGDPCLLGNIQY